MGFIKEGDEDDQKLFQREFRGIPGITRQYGEDGITSILRVDLVPGGIVILASVDHTPETLLSIADKINTLAWEVAEKKALMLNSTTGEVGNSIRDGEIEDSLEFREQILEEASQSMVLRELLRQLRSIAERRLTELREKGKREN